MNENYTSSSTIIITQMVLAALVQSWYIYFIETSKIKVNKKKLKCSIEKATAKNCELNWTLHVIESKRDTHTQIYHFTHHRCSVFARGSAVAKLHSKRTLCAVHLGHCNRCYIESFFLSSIGIRPNVPVPFHILHCIRATYNSNTCNNFVGFSLLAFACGYECCPAASVTFHWMFHWSLVNLAVLHTDCIPNKSVH